MGKDITIGKEGKGEVILYQTPDGQTSLDVKLENIVWLTRRYKSMREKWKNFV